jgi:flagellar hook-length control protein FliK
MAGNNESSTPQNDILRSEGRARHTETRNETAAHNNNIFFQNLTNAVENTLDNMSVTEARTPASTIADAMDLINQINSQIRAVIDNETQSLSMQLHPQSLGRLNVELVAKAGQLTAQFEAENASVKAALETRIAELKETLEQRGVKVESVEVTIASHEFEQNLMGGEQSGTASEGSQGRGRRNRSINLNEAEKEGSEGEDAPEDEKIAREIMAANGNSVDFTA